jgi:orotate phosphoribosyltransferase-like protein
MHDLNVPHGKIAQALNVSDDTVTNYTLRRHKFGFCRI